MYLHGAGSLGEIPSSGSWSGRRWPLCRSSLESSPWIAGTRMFAWFPLVVGLVAPDCRHLFSEEVTSGTMASSGSTRKASFSTWLGWHSRRLCGRVVGSVDTSHRGRSNLMSGWRPQMSWCRGCGLRAIILYSLGYGLSVHAALQLEVERWYVGVATSEGGVGGLCRTRRSHGKSSRRPRNFRNFDGICFVSCER